MRDIPTTAKDWHERHTEIMLELRMMYQNQDVVTLHDAEKYLKTLLVCLESVNERISGAVKYPVRRMPVFFD